MQTTSTNNRPCQSRSCSSGIRLVGLSLIVCLLASNFAAGQSVQLPNWNAPEISQPAAFPNNQIRTQIGLATYDQPQPQALAPLNAGTNAPVMLSPAPVHAPIQTQIQAAAFETDVPNAVSSDATADGFAGTPVTADSIAELFNSQAAEATSPEGIWPSIKVGLLLAVLSLAPAIILMTTCYVRVVVVLTLLRQAFGGQQLPPMQVITALSLFMTLLIMAPVWTKVKTEAIDPYTREQSPITWEEAWQRGIEPVKHFMVTQIQASGNTDSVAVFYKHLPNAGTPPSTLEQVPVNVLLPAFLISELKVAFLLGFQIFLPFLVLDLVVSSVTVSSGMMMLPPTMVSFPLKLILFVMVDGWNLVVGMLLQSFAPI